MRHAYMYNGAFETNYSDLRPGTTTYKSTEGEERALPDWPEKIDGIRVGLHGEGGKEVLRRARAVRQPRRRCLENPVHIDPLRHMGNRRFSADPTLVTDDEASALLDDIIRDNPDKQPELAMMINRINQIRRAARSTDRVVSER